MHVAQLWRYPIKSTRGEELDAATLSADGVAGDRLVHVRLRRWSKVLTARARRELLSLSGVTAPDGTILLDGHPWDSAEAASALHAVAGPDAELVAYAGPERFDILPLLVATDGAITALGHDGRRLRPNIVIGGVEGLAERGWPGRALRIGEALIGLHSLRARCIITTIDPDTNERNVDVLRRIHDEFDGQVALNAWVARGGIIHTGDPVELLDTQMEEPVGGGWVVGAPYRVL